MSDPRYSAVRSALGRAFNDGGWLEGRDAELRKLSDSILDDESPADLSSLGQRLSTGFVKQNKIDRSRASQVLASRAGEIRAALDHTVAPPTPTFSNFTINAPGGNVAVGNRDVTQFSRFVVRAGDHEGLRQALSELGLTDEDISEALQLADGTKTEKERVASVRGEPSPARSFASRIADAYLAAALSVPVDVAVGLVTTLLGQFWGIGG